MQGVSGRNISDHSTLGRATLFAMAKLTIAEKKAGHGAAGRSTGVPGASQDAHAASQELLLRQECAALHRERDLRYAQLQAAREREQAAREREALLLQMLQAAQ
jgi:hypothetical protein